MSLDKVTSSLAFGRERQGCNISFDYPTCSVLANGRLHRVVAVDAMRCPKCGCQEDKVIDSRASREGSAIRRRRECVGCGHRYTTYEQVERPRLMVLKRDGRTEEFSKAKLLSGIEKACQKRPVSPEQIDNLIEHVINDMAQRFDREVPAIAIGVRVMEALRELDAVAYVRYASVYRRFDEATDFVQEVKKLEKPYDTLTARLPGI